MLKEEKSKWEYEVRAGVGKVYANFVSGTSENLICL